MERYLAAPYDPALRPDDRLLAFLDKLARNAAIAEWQVHQAEDAVCLFRQFAGTRQAAGVDAAVAGQRPTAPGPGAAGPPAPAPLALNAEWHAALAGMTKILELRNYSPRTERTYMEWTRQFAQYCGMRPPAELGEDDVQRYLTHLAMRRQVSASTQNQAFSALLFLFRDVLVRPLEGLQDTVRDYFFSETLFGKNGPRGRERCA